MKRHLQVVITGDTASLAKAIREYEAALDATPMRHYPPKRTGPHTGWSPSRNRLAQQYFRNALIQRSGGTCEYPGCASTDRLQAHHDKAGYDPECGRLLCWHHHKREDPHAR